MLPQVGPAVSPIWPPVGIALAALLRFGLDLWPGVWLAAFAAALLAGEPVWSAVMLAVGGTLAPLLGALALRREGLFAH